MILLAEARTAPTNTARAAALREGFRAGGIQYEAAPFYFIGGAIVLAAVVGAVYALYQSWRRQLASDSPWGLFHELCRLHGLSRSERRLLARLAEARRLKQPAVLFIEPAHWSTPAAGDPSLVRGSLVALRKRLFE